MDTWTLTAIADELRGALLGGRVQQIVQVDEGGFAFEVFKAGRRRYLLASADRQAPRLHLLDDKPRRGVDAPSPLLQLLRKFVRDGRLLAVSQPAWERVLQLEFEHPEHGASLLVAELIGRWANLLLLRPAEQPGAGPVLRILECLWRIKPPDAPAETGPASPARTLLPGQIYAPPPPQQGCPPTELSELRLRGLLDEAGPSALLWRVLAHGVLGFSPVLARELVFRAMGDVQTTVSQVQRLQPICAMAADFVSLARDDQWQPCMVVDVKGDVLAFAPYPLLHRLAAGRVTLQPASSISAAAAAYYARQAAGDSYAAPRQQVGRLIERAAGKLNRRLEAIEREVRPVEEIEQLRLAGEWILALAAQIRPRQAELRVPEEAEVAGNVVRLDSALSPADNAAAYFKRYRKARRAAEAAGARRAEIAGELDYLGQLAADLALAADRSEIDAVRWALAEAGHAQRPARPAAASPPPSLPRRFASKEGYAILVGRNSQQNEHVTFDLAGPDDLWLHARGWPGSHVVIRSGGRPLSEETLRQAAELAAYFSQARSETWVDVIVAERRHVRRAPGRRPGMVTMDHERTLRVRPAAPVA